VYQPIHPKNLTLKSDNFLFIYVKIFNSISQSSEYRIVCILRRVRHLAFDLWLDIISISC